MNVKELTERIEYELRWAPSIQSHRSMVAGVLTDTYRELAEAYTWPWMVAKAPLWVFPDLTIANANLTRLSARSFELATDALMDAGAYAAEDAGVSGEWKRALAGALFDLADPTLRDQGNGNWQLAPFEVENVEDSATGGKDTVLFLDPRCNITAITGNEGSYKLKVVRYQLPADCANVLRIRNSDNTPLNPLRTQDALRITEQTGSPPRSWYNDTGLELRLPEWRFPIGKLTPASPVARSLTAYGLRNDAVFASPPVSLVAANGNLPLDTYEVFCAWWWAGRLSPASAKVELRCTTGGITVATAPVLPDNSYGRRLTVWYGRRGGPYYLHEMATTATQAVWTDITDLPATELFQTVRWDEARMGSGYRYIRIHPRPAAVERMEVDYIRRFRPLVDPTDEPEFDGAFHDVLVWSAVMKIAAQQNAEGRLRSAEVLYRERYTALRRRYGIDDRHRLVRASFETGGTTGLPVQDFPEIDWQG